MCLGPGVETNEFYPEMRYCGPQHRHITITKLNSVLKCLKTVIKDSCNSIDRDLFYIFNEKLRTFGKFFVNFFRQAKKCDFFLEIFRSVFHSRLDL